MMRVMCHASAGAAPSARALGHVTRHSRSLSTLAASSRRDVFLSGSVAALIVGSNTLNFPAPALASEAATSVYTDEADGFTLSIPPNWTAGQGETEALGANVTRRVLAWYPDASNPNRASVSVVVTNVAADFTGLGSFGTPDAFGQTLVNGLDRSYTAKASWGRPAKSLDEIQTAKLLETGSMGGMYTVEYQVKRPGQGVTHLWEVVALCFNGTYNRLYTVTGQCGEEDLEKLGGEVKTVLDSFHTPESKVGLAP